jgi:chromosome segregation ATPase
MTASWHKMHIKHIMYPKINDNDRQKRTSIDNELTRIRDYIEKEITFKQGMIIQLQSQLQELESLVIEKDVRIESLQEKLEECRQSTEGMRQLMNKLLNDIGNYQKDIAWYRRTYEQRSLLGILKDKFLRKTNQGDDGNG